LELAAVGEGEEASDCIRVGLRGKGWGLGVRATDGGVLPRDHQAAERLRCGHVRRKVFRSHS